MESVVAGGADGEVDGAEVAADPGAVVPFGSTTQARQVLLDWAADPDTARRLGAAGRRIVSAEYDWEQEGRRLVAFVQARAG